MSEQYILDTYIPSLLTGLWKENNEKLKVNIDWTNPPLPSELPSEIFAELPVKYEHIFTTNDYISIQNKLNDLCQFFNILITSNNQQFNNFFMNITNYISTFIINNYTFLSSFNDQYSTLENRLDMFALQSLTINGNYYQFNEDNKGKIVIKDSILVGNYKQCVHTYNGLTGNVIGLSAITYNNSIHLPDKNGNIVINYVPKSVQLVNTYNGKTGNIFDIDNVTIYENYINSFNTITLNGIVDINNTIYKNVNPDVYANKYNAELTSPSSNCQIQNLTDLSLVPKSYISNKNSSTAILNFINFYKSNWRKITPGLYYCSFNAYKLVNLLNIYTKYLISDSYYINNSIVCSFVFTSNNNVDSIVLYSQSIIDGYLTICQKQSELNYTAKDNKITKINNKFNLRNVIIPNYVDENNTNISSIHIKEIQNYNNFILNSNCKKVLFENITINNKIDFKNIKYLYLSRSLIVSASYFKTIYFPQLIQLDILWNSDYTYILDFSNLPSLKTLNYKCEKKLFIENCSQKYTKNYSVSTYYDGTTQKYALIAENSNDGNVFSKTYINHLNINTEKQQSDYSNWDLYLLGSTVDVQNKKIIKYNGQPTIDSINKKFYTNQSLTQLFDDIKFKDLYINAAFHICDATTCIWHLISNKCYINIDINSFDCLLQLYKSQYQTFFNIYNSLIFSNEYYPISSAVIAKNNNLHFYITNNFFVKQVCKNGSFVDQWFITNYLEHLYYKFININQKYNFIISQSYSAYSSLEFKVFSSNKGKITFRNNNNKIYGYSCINNSGTYSYILLEDDDVISLKLYIGKNFNIISDGILIDLFTSDNDLISNHISSFDLKIQQSEDTWQNSGTNKNLNGNIFLENNILVIPDQNNKGNGILAGIYNMQLINGVLSSEYTVYNLENINSKITTIRGQYSEISNGITNCATNSFKFFILNPNGILVLPSSIIQYSTEDSLGFIPYPNYGYGKMLIFPKETSGITNTLGKQIKSCFEHICLINYNFSISSGISLFGGGFQQSCTFHINNKLTENSDLYNYLKEQGQLISIVFDIDDTKSIDGIIKQILNI